MTRSVSPSSIGRSIRNHTNNHLARPEIDQKPIMAQCCSRCFCWSFLALAASAIVLVILYIYPPPPRYYASVPTVTLIDSNLELDVALRVLSPFPLWGHQACLPHGTGVAVAYHGLPVAFGATGAKVCTSRLKPWLVGTTMVAMQRTNVGGLPIVKGLIDDWRRRVGVYEVTFQIQMEAPNDGKLVTCVVKPFEDNGPTACHVEYS